MRTSSGQCGKDVFQSTLPAREATHTWAKARAKHCISIHASREGSDVPDSISLLHHDGFQSTLPAREATSLRARSSLLSRIFQSTLPAREATLVVELSCSTVVFQSTLPAREATADMGLQAVNVLISIHASREGSDLSPPAISAMTSKFQSTLPAREATVTWTIRLPRPIYFNPRFPRGKRRIPIRPTRWSKDFNPRFPRGKRRTGFFNSSS